MRILPIILLLVLVGCNSNKLAEEDMTRILELDSSLVQQNFEAQQIMLRVLRRTEFEKNLNVVRLLISKPGKKPDVNELLDAFSVTQLNSEKVLASFQDKLIFLRIQGERSMGLKVATIVPYIQSNKSIFEILKENQDETETDTDIDAGTDTALP
jgi:hypothetical protein